MGKIIGKLWQNNTECPNCGRNIRNPQEIRSCETGYSYCSLECAYEHVNKNAPEEGY